MSYSRPKGPDVVGLCARVDGEVVSRRLGVACCRGGVGASCRHDERWLWARRDQRCLRHLGASNVRLDSSDRSCRGVVVLGGVDLLGRVIRMEGRASARPSDQGLGFRF